MAPKRREWEAVELTDPDEVQAALDGEIECDRYKDGSVWADAISLAAWREGHRGVR